MKRAIFGVLIGLGLLTFLGCKKFLEVEPKSSVSDKNLFSSEIGFQQALTGVYVNMASHDLYGAQMTMGALSVLAQNYNTDPSNAFFQLSNFNYVDNVYLANIWNRSFNAIAIINNLLSQIDQQQHVFSGGQYALVKGEALALRAYLHIDLARLFGPQYEQGAKQLAIPYRLTFDTKIAPAISLERVLALALADLAEAELLLEDDPIKSGELVRRYYMNYYAVLATQARVFQYLGNDAQAAKKAQAVLDAKIFDFVKSTDITTTDEGLKDRLFSSELIFALRVREMDKWVSQGSDGYPVYFKYRTVNYGNLTLTIEQYRQLFEANSPVGESDYRFKNLIEVDGTLYFSVKYWQTWVGSTERGRLDQTVPLIRLSELYYILAEGATSVPTSLTYLNTVRQHRGIVEDLSPQIIASPTLLRAEITKEYQKEFYAEGQTFFYYKRIASPSMLFLQKTMLPADYRVNIPQTELEFNPSFDSHE